MRWILVLWLLIGSLFAWGQPRKTVETVSYALFNLDTNEQIISVNEDNVRPIASMTKLMSALVILQNNLDLDELVTVTGPERSTRIRRGMLIRRGELLELSLVGSDNLAARTLAETYPGGYREFIDQMNLTAQNLGMTNTTYSDATGLLATNTSTVQDLYRLATMLPPWEIFTNAANKINTVATAMVASKRGAQEIRVAANNTNNFVGKLDIIAAKTGYTTRAGRCLTMMFTQNGNRYFLVVMGAQNPQHRTRIVNQLLDTIK
jgi:serine-type D-Ala-D-Ala endopeptidase (penicillin-binding protein 7)